MKYVLRKVTDDVLDFHAASEVWLVPLIFRLVGLIFFSGGLYGLISGFNQDAGEPLAQLLLGAGGMFLSIGILAGRAGSEVPRRIRFDNKAAHILISQDKNLKETVTLPYQRIRDFTSRWTNGSSGSNKATQGIYQVLMTTIDLQVWILGEFRNPEKAEAHRKYLSEMIDRSKTATEMPVSVTRKVTVERNGETARLLWKSNEQPARMSGILLLASMLLLMNYIYNQFGFPEIFYYLIGGVMMVIMGVLVILIFSRWSEQCRLEIADGKFRYLKVRGTFVKLVREVDVSTIRAIGVNFENNRASGILIADEEMFNVLSGVSSRKISWSDVLNVYRKLRTVFNLPASGWSGVDRIRFAEMLRMLVQAHQGNRLI